MTNVYLNTLLAKISDELLELTIPVYVEISRRDEGMSTTHKAKVPVERIGPNLDGKGFRICIEESQIKWEEYL